MRSISIINFLPYDFFFNRSLEETVLRETYEEVGIESSKVDVWGAGPLVGRAEMTVTPFLAHVGVIDPNRLKINPEEVLINPR